MLLRRLVPLVVLIGLTFVLLLPTSSSVVMAQQPVPISAFSTFTVLAGFEDVDADGLHVEAFLPENVTVRQGDSITWKFTALEPHTVTFLSGAERPGDFIELPDGRMALNPEVAFPSGGPEYDGTGVVNSGFVNVVPGGDLTYTLTFPQRGTFEYVCLIHPFMTGTVTVLAADAPPPLPQSAIDTEAEQEKQDFIAEIGALHRGPPKAIARDDGTKEYGLLAGLSTQKVDLMHFHEPVITIFTGDTVTWSLEASGPPHTVSFVPRGQEEPEAIVLEPQDAGPPLLLLNPVAAAPAGGDTLDPAAYTNSGLLFNPAFGPPGVPGEYSLTFTEPGSYNYLCLLHPWMKGTIRVSPIVPPSVGGSSVTPLIGTVAGIAGLILVLGGGYLVRCRVKRAA